MRDAMVARRPAPARKLTFDSNVASTPGEFPNDIPGSNPYAPATTPGLAVAHFAPFGNAGTVVLPALAPGQGINVQNAVPGGMQAGAACSATQH